MESLVTCKCSFQIFVIEEVESGLFCKKFKFEIVDYELQKKVKIMQKYLVHKDGPSTKKPALTYSKNVA
ncbi:hypothetical protein L596_012380 [Steinernema carpocapsae]|uniref:Uncharacterized protein n=1 Tax=Steinernema carpocapsae TaxID=34508 RepID=A0A4V6A4T7_STECR|nr:hypothetical protein L596_012380 [Steinernema carpocapsae]